MKMTLRKALQKKNILAGQIRELRELIEQKNSYDESLPETTRVDTTKLMASLLTLQIKLVNLKSAITVANTEIYPTLAHLDETKGFIKFLDGIDTKEGTFEQGGRFGGPSIKITFKAYISEAKIREMKAAGQLEIEDLQEKIDEFNAAHFIEVDL